MATRQRKPSRLAVAKARRLARRGEEYVALFSFPDHLGKRVRRKLPELDDLGWLRVERGLREWFACCAWRGTMVLGMPSRAVDEAWHEFILDTAGYTAFCQGAFGAYLHHTPDEVMSTPMAEALAETVRAWDRSAMGEAGESILWDLDRELGIAPALGLSAAQLEVARNRPRSADGSGSGWLGDPGGNGADGGCGSGCGGGCGGGGGG